MTKDCNTCIYKEGSCYPSTTIFDKDKTCKSYDPDYEGYIAELEQQFEKMRNCGNCNGIIEGGIRTKKCKICMSSKDLSQWELRK